MQGKSQSSAPQRGSERSDAQQTEVGSRDRRGREERHQGSIGASAAISALSRVFAVLGIMVLLGLLGAVIDRWLSTQFAMLIGIVIGTVIAVIGMIYAVKVVEIEQRQARERLDVALPTESLVGAETRVQGGSPSEADDSSREAIDTVSEDVKGSEMKGGFPGVGSDSRP